MRSGKANSILLVVCVVISLFVSSLYVPVSISPGGERPVQLYVVDAADSRSSWVGSTSAVRDGINAARADARDRTKVKLAGETIPEPIVIDSAADLEYLVNNAPERAVFINTHGETVPMPTGYLSAQVSITSPLNGQVIDANVTGYSLTITAVVKTFGGGELAGLPSMRWFEPTGAYGQPPVEKGPVLLSLVDPVDSLYRCTVDLCYTFLYEFRVSAVTVRGLNAVACVTVDFRGLPLPNPICMGPPRPPVPTCPYMYPWNGSCFVMDNNVLAHNGSAVDYCMLEKSLARGADGNFSVRLEESGGKRDFFDRVGLLAVDHPDYVSVHVDANGTVSTCSNLRAPDGALFNGHYSVLAYVGTRDDRGYPFWSCDRLEFESAGLSGSSLARLVLRTCSDEEAVVSVKRPDDYYGWVTLAEVRSRVFWGTSVVNLTRWLPELADDRLVLSFSGHCLVDFVGVDTSPEASVTVHEGELVYAVDSTGVRATFGSLLREDGVCARLKRGYTVDLGFRLPVLNGSGLERDFILVSEGYCVEDGGVAGGLGGVGLVELVVDWMDWFDLLEDRCRTKGWVWANVAGYSFCYFGTKEYWDFMGPAYDPTLDSCQPRWDGLKQYMSKDVTCCFYDSHRAERSYDFVERTGFDPLKAYSSLPDNVTCKRPLANMDLMWNTVGYVDMDDGHESHVTASVTMNGTNPGIFVHNGLDEDADGDSSPGTYHDDYLKGYMATVLAIEEARAFLLAPQFDSCMVGDWDDPGSGNNHSAAFTINMLPGGWGLGDEWFPGAGYHHYRYVDLRLGLAASYQGWLFRDDLSGYYVECALSVNDFILSGNDPRVWGKVLVTESGWEVGGTSTAYNNKYGWWALSQTMAAYGGGYFPGLARSLVPLFTEQPATPDASALNSSINTVYANGTLTDPDNNKKGAMSFYFRIMFWYDTPGESYSFTLSIVSWIRNTFYWDPFKQIWVGEKTRAQALSTVPLQLQFTIQG